MTESQRMDVVKGPPATCSVGAEVFVAPPKVFSTGSVGYYSSRKITVHGNVCQLSLCLTVVGSKNGQVPVQDATAPKKAPGSPRTRRTLKRAAQAPLPAPSDPETPQALLPA